MNASNLIKTVIQESNEGCSFCAGCAHLWLIIFCISEQKCIIDRLLLANIGHRHAIEKGPHEHVMTVLEHIDKIDICLLLCLCRLGSLLL